ncbi:ATP cone domain-containing protein [Candidatus Nitrosotenuis chungbukensis]|uniref:ATP cone domain-containing protein n=1 Tax=Candidatus Nitrosotenuis chungbukensis TaxID=1353246 RepID=UPI000694D186|nr:ATP cone domain-containing protein [Candidatus Nitrosotenuis chungbukensis]WKT58652.1 ATP cone domain-containing protein [Candidatus Nitrosotenuis chungbukensis]
MKKIIIIKANGEKATFDVRKVESTCIRAGANPRSAKKIARQVHHQIHHGMTTKQIYSMVLNLLLQTESPAIKQRYRLKESIMMMGPAGFSFETFVGQILEKYGYTVRSISSEVQGRCITHEVDLTVESDRDKRKWLVECKYHNLPGKYTGLKESLYTHARFLDLADKFDNEMLVCNTKVSSDVIKYANCVGQKILSWRYPQDAGLERMIEDKKLYPITILSPTGRELESFFQNKIMIAKDLLDIDIGEFAHKTKIPIRRILSLQKLVNQIIT